MGDFLRPEPSFVSRRGWQVTGHKSRSALLRAGVEGLSVGAIQDKLGVPASTLSHHVRKLVDTGLVTQERQATTLICRAHYPAMTSLIGYLSDECCADGSCPPRSSVKAKAQETVR